MDITSNITQLPHKHDYDVVLNEIRELSIPHLKKRDSEQGQKLEWNRFSSCLEHAEQIICHEKDFISFTGYIRTSPNKSALKPSTLLKDWFQYYACLLKSYDQLHNSPMFKRFRVNRYEMLTRFDEWMHQYQELSLISNVKPDNTILAWPEFIEHFHIRKLIKYLAAFWVQWQGVKTSHAKKIIAMLGLRTKASLEELKTIKLPYPPGYSPVSTINPAQRKAPEASNDILLLFQPVFNNNSTLHHSEVSIRLADDNKQTAQSSVEHEIKALSILNERLPHSEYPVAISLCPDNISNTRLIRQLDQMTSQPELAHKLIIQLDCARITDCTNNLYTSLEKLSESGCHLILDNCGTTSLPSGRLLELFHFFRPHAQILHDSKDDLAARLIINELTNYCRANGLKAIAQTVDSSDMNRHQRALAFDLCQGNWLSGFSLHPSSSDSEGIYHEHFDERECINA